MTKLTQVNYPMLPTKDNGFINKIKNELNDTMAKRQVFRTMVIQNKKLRCFVR